MALRTLIVGAGVAGLSAAFDLERAGVPVTVVERRSRLGGAVETHRIPVEGGGTCIFEGGADSFIAQKPAALQLIADVGLSSEVIGSNDHQRLTFIKRNGGLVPLPDGLMMMLPTRVWPMAKTGLLSWPTKIRMGLEYFRAGQPSTAERTVEDFILEHFPREMLDYLVEPLLSGVYGGDPAHMSADAVLTRFVELERKHGSLVKAALSTPMPKSTGGSLFRTLKNGLGSLVDAIRPRDVLLGREVETIEPIQGGDREARWRLRVAGDWMEASSVLLTGPAYNAANLVQPFAPRAAELLNSVGYSSSATVTLVYRKAKLNVPLPGFGLLVPRVERKRLLACTFVRNKFDHRVPEGWEAIRCFFGGASDEAAVREPDASLQQYACDELRDLFGVKAEPESAVVSRWDRAMAQYGVGHSARIAELRSVMEKHPGLHLAGNAFQGIGVPDCIETGRAAARKILGVSISAAAK